MTLQKIALLGATVAVLGLPAATQAATKPAAAHAGAAAAGGGDLDARCMALALMMTSSQDQRTHGMGAQSLTFYLGRVDARPAKASLESHMAAQFPTLLHDKQVQQATAQACIKQMDDSFKAFQPAAEQLSKQFGSPAPAAGAAAPQAKPATPAPAH